MLLGECYNEATCETPFSYDEVKVELMMCVEVPSVNNSHALGNALEVDT